MSYLLEFLISHLSFLYDDYGVRFVDSRIEGFGAMLVFETDDLRMKLVNDRDRISIEFQNCDSDPAGVNWYTIDIVRQLLTGTVNDNAELNEEQLLFIQDNFVEIRDAFNATNRHQSENKLHAFEEARAKRLFG